MVTALWGEWHNMKNWTLLASHRTKNAADDLMCSEKSFHITNSAKFIKLMALYSNKQPHYISVDTKCKLWSNNCLIQLIMLMWSMKRDVINRRTGVSILKLWNILTYWVIVSQIAEMFSPMSHCIDKNITWNHLKCSSCRNLY